MAKVRTNKPVSNKIDLKLTESKVNLTKSQETWFLIKQVWYVPFSWSLSYYLYWIIRDVVVFNKTVFQIPLLNWGGVVISIALLLAGFQNRTSAQKERQSHVSVQSTSLELPRRMEVRWEKPTKSPMQKNVTEKLKKPRKQLLSSPQSLNTCPQNFGYSNVLRNYEEMLPECLLCKELSRCKIATRAARNPNINLNEKKT
jgi:hypothetical protein